MNAPKAPRRLSARRDDPLPSLPAPNGFSLEYAASRSRFAALADKRSDGPAALSLGGGGGAGAVATPHKVWLGSLPSTLSEVELRERLDCFGTIQSFFYKPEQPGAVAARATADQQQNKKARGWAFVSYATAEEAQALIRAMDGKSPDTVFPVAGASLAAPGMAPPIEARLANATKSSGSLSQTSGASDSRTNHSEEELHSREKLLALAFFSPSRKPSAAGRASSLAPLSVGVSTSEDTNNTSSIRCSSHPRVTNTSSIEKPGGSAANSSVHLSLPHSPGEQSKQTTYSSLHGNSAASPSSPSSGASAPFSHLVNGKLLEAGPTEQHRQPLKHSNAGGLTPPAPMNIPPPPAGSGNTVLSQVSTSDKLAVTTADNAVKGAMGATTHAAPPPGDVVGSALSTTAGEGTSPPLPNIAASPSPRQDQQQQSLLDGSSNTIPASHQRAKRVYGGLPAAAFPPLSAAAATHTGGNSARPPQARPDKPNLPSLWEVYWTPDTHQPYFYNAISKHVQWERPLPPREYVEQAGNPMTAELGPPGEPFLERDHQRP